jgi:hypothetical protein
MRGQANQCPDFFTAASTGDPGHVDVRAPTTCAIYNGCSRGRARACDRIGDDDLDAANWLSGSVLALPPVLHVLSCPF